MSITPCELLCEDGRRLAATLTTPPAHSHRTPLVLVHGATAVRRDYYQPLAQHLAAQGLRVLTWDPRGMGDSRAGPARADTARMRDWGRLDLEAAIQHGLALAHDDASRLALVGHSSGGHLAGLAPALPRLKHLALVASGSCDWRLYPRREWPRLLAAWYGLAPLALATLGYMPGRLGVGHDLPPGVAREWRNWSVTRGYLFSDGGLDRDAYARYAGRLLALHFSDDTGFAPPGAVRHLLAQFPHAEVERREFDPGARNHPAVGHFGFFQPRHAALWPLLSDWLLRAWPAGSEAVLQGQTGLRAVVPAAAAG